MTFIKDETNAVHKYIKCKKEQAIVYNTNLKGKALKDLCTNHELKTGHA